MNPRPKVAVLIAVHNRLHYTIKCLDSLKVASKTANLSIIIVDDGSTDGTSQWIAANTPDITILKGDGNLWFGGAVKLGTGYIKEHMPDAEYVLFINNDNFAQPGCIDALIAESRGEAAVGAMLLDGSCSRVYSFGIFWNWRKGWVDPSTGLVLSEHPELVSGISKSVQMLSTGCSLVPMKWLKIIKGIDVIRYPQHKADTSLFSQISKAGASLHVTSRAIATNEDDAIHPRYSIRNRTFSIFLKESLTDKKCPMYLPNNIFSTWETAPSKPLAIPVIICIVMRHVRQILVSLLLSIFHYLKISKYINVSKD